MSSKSIVDQIRHYQKDIERCPENSERMIRCIQRLYVLPILVQHLQETGVGRSVNSLRKFNGEVGEAAKALVTKWKAMVAAEESDDGDCAPKESDAKRNPPNARSDENGSKTLISNSSSKHDSSRHSSSHKRSHSSTTSESKADRKSSSSSTDKTDRKSSSEKNDKHRHSQHESKSREIAQVKEDKGSKSHVNSKDGDRSSSSSHRSKSERKDKDEDSDHSPGRKKRKKNCVKERRKETQESDDGSSGREDATQDRESEPDRVLPDLSDEDSDDDRGDFGENNSAHDSDKEEDGESEKCSSSEGDSDPKSRKKLSSSEHHKSNSSSHGSSTSSKNKHSHYKEEKSDSKKSSSSSSKSSSKDLQRMIKENEKKIKREKFEKTNYDSGGSTPKGSSSPIKSKEKSVKVKVETNDDGSIDAGSGFSFADALAGIDPSPKKKKKASKDGVSSPKPSSSVNSSSSSHHKSSSSFSHSQKKSSSSSLPSVKREKYSDTAMPELLKRPIKLENLELDINSTLPEINPNYRPLPHVPENSRRNSTKSATNEEEMFNMMMIKNQRTKVFSGGKSSHNTEVPTLYDLCIKLLYDNIDGLEYTGGVPYDLLKPLLKKLNPDQLFVLEHYNAYLIEDTGTLWEFHSKKDFRNKGRQEGETWRDLYIRCMEEREEKLKALTQNITQSIAASTPVRKAKLAYVDSAVKPPRNIARKQAKYGTGAGDASPIMKAHAAEKREILAKAVVGAHDPANIATTTVPAPPQSSGPRSWSMPAPVSQKKRKAPLMAKALQLIKGTNRFKR